LYYEGVWEEDTAERDNPLESVSLGAALLT
jgi:hypothetical protein